ncbi:unnamed protein product [Phytophthora fragariaefolia]|uniref:Unnamed protein product n=1 Tax=Phytophthora fragariaefolia TaxID=1490495 RepID=A0A9W6XM75_9STRA|nr:unnamed protein product [Phytophthora fragariaefolia]
MYGRVVDLGSVDLNSQADVDLGLGLPWVCVFLSLLAASSSGGLKLGLTDARPSNLGVWVHFDLGVFDVWCEVSGGPMLMDLDRRRNFRYRSTTEPTSVMPILEGKDMLLGWPWLEEVNPDINWTERTITCHGNTQSLICFRQRVRCLPARHVGGRRRSLASRNTTTGSDDTLQRFYMRQDYAFSCGPTRVVSTKWLKKPLRASDNEFCFMTQFEDSEKADRRRSHDWDALKGHPAKHLLLKYKDVGFRAQLPSVPPTRDNDIKPEIELVDDTPVARKQFQLSEGMKAAIREWPQEMLQAGIIRRSKLPAIPVPRKEAIFNAMRNGKLLSAMDLLWGFFQVRLREQDVPYRKAPDGLFEYLVTPMGLSCSPAAFNRLMQNVLADQGSFCKAYFDDLFVITPSHDVAEDLVVLERVLRHDLLSFLGTCVYALKFCSGYAALTAPLTELVKGKSRNERIEFNEEQLTCFNELKKRLAKPTVLAHPDFTKMFRVKMDASDYAVGGYLYQLDDVGHDHINAYGGRKLAPAEIKYPTREKELHAALYAMRTWKVYLIDKLFEINTDRRTLESILRQNTCSQRLAGWLNELAMYQPHFNGSKKVGDENTANGVSIHLYAQRRQAVPSHSILQQCARLYDSGLYFGPIWKDSRRRQQNGRFHDSQICPKLHVLITFSCRMTCCTTIPSRTTSCVPDYRDLRERLLFEEHDTASRGHPSVYKTLRFLQSKYYWPSMANTVRVYCGSCEICMRTKSPRKKESGLLHPLDVPEGRWKHITMDFVVVLRETKLQKFDAVMVIVDRLTKRGHFIATKTTATAQDTAKRFRDYYQRLHGLSLSIVCDRDSKFTSKLWTHPLELQDTKLCPSSAFKPSTDGQKEITNRYLGDYLRAYVAPHQNDWHEFLALAEFGMAPFEADLVIIPRSVSDLEVPPRQGLKDASRFIDVQQAILEECQDLLDQAQQRMKFYFDRNRPSLSFQVGDEVLLDKTNLALHHVGSDGKRSLRLPNGYSSLHLAALSGHIGVVRSLLDNGVSIDTVDKSGWTALMSASRIGKTDVVEMLVESGAVVDKQLPNGCASLHLATETGHFNVACVLIHNGSSLDLIDTNGWTAPMVASQNGRIDIANELVRRGASVDKQLPNECTCLHLALSVTLLT